MIHDYSQCKSFRVVANLNDKVMFELFEWMRLISFDGNINEL